MAESRDSKLDEINAAQDEQRVARPFATHRDILHIGFNQDSSCLAVGLRNGFHIFDCVPFVKRFSSTDGGFLHVEMLFCTSLVALVGGGDQPAFSPRRLRLWDTSKRTALCELKFVSSIAAVRLNRKRVVVCEEQLLHIFDITCAMKCLHTLSTSPNAGGLIAFSPNEENCFLAFPGDGIGEVVIYDAIALKVLNKMIASKSKMTVMTFSQSGTLLATASKQGTVIRVFTVPGAQQVHVLRRGSYSSKIRCLAFNMNAARLAVTGSSNTVHIFDVSLPQSLQRNQGKSQKNRTSVMRVSSSVKQVASLLPLSKSAGEYVDSNRAIAQAHLHSNCSPHSCALVPSGVSISVADDLLVVTDEGTLLRYNVPEEGGECRLACADILFDERSDENGSSMFYQHDGTHEPSIT